MRLRAKGEVTSTLPPVPKSTVAFTNAPPDMSTNRKLKPKKTTKYTWVEMRRSRRENSNAAIEATMNQFTGPAAGR
jgi:hypothetical protein